MKYYKVNKKYDGISINKLTLICNELFTEKEREKYNIPFRFLEERNISKNNIFWSFGCRFEIGV